MRVEHLLVSIVKTIALFASLGLAVTQQMSYKGSNPIHRSSGDLHVAESHDIRLDAFLESDKRTLCVELRNMGNATYLLPLGLLFQSTRFQRLTFKLLTPDKIAKPLVLSFDEPGVIGGNGASWVIVLPKGAKYGFSFPFKALRLRTNTQISVADSHDRYTIEVSFAGLDPTYGPDIQFVRNWPHDELKNAMPFWQGTLSTVVRM